MPRNILVITLLILALLALGVTSFYLTLKGKGERMEKEERVPTLPEEPVVESQEPTTTEAIDTSDWKTYRNEEWGFEVKYPPQVFNIVVEQDKVSLKEASPPILPDPTLKDVVTLYTIEFKYLPREKASWCKPLSRAEAVKWLSEHRIVSKHIAWEAMVEKGGCFMVVGVDGALLQTYLPTDSGFILMSLFSPRYDYHRALIEFVYRIILSTVKI